MPTETANAPTTVAGAVAAMVGAARAADVVPSTLIADALFAVGVTTDNLIAIEAATAPGAHPGDELVKLAQLVSDLATAEGGVMACAGRVAFGFGDAPDVAIVRMRRARRAASLMLTLVPAA